MNIQEHYNKDYYNSYFNGMDNMNEEDSFTVEHTKPLMNDLINYINENKYKNPLMLEIGCGMGWNVHSLRKLGFNIEGCDFSRTFIERAKKKYGNYYFFHDIEEKPLANNYDVIYSLDVIEHLFNYDNALQNIRNSLNNNGILALSTPNILSLRYRFNFFLGDYSPFKSFEHIRFFSPAHLSKVLIKNGFTIKKIFTYGRIKYPKSVAGTFMIIAELK